MKDFGNIDYTTGSFPSAVAEDSSGPTVRDGTPLVADWVNDLWGAFQAVLSKAGATPSGATETAATSDFLNSIRKISGAPGEILFWGGRDSDFSAHENRLLLLAGQAVSVASYLELSAAVYCGDAANGTASSFYKTTDAGGTLRSTLGTYLVLPDCRGYFVRGLNGATATVDTDRILDGVEAEPGSVQAYQTGSHAHYVGHWSGVFPLGSAKITELESYWVYPTDPGGSAVEDDFMMARNSDISLPSPPGAIGDGFAYSGGFDETRPTDIEARPQNLAFHLMIRF